MRIVRQNGSGSICEEQGVERNPPDVPMQLDGGEATRYGVGVKAM